jgi:hypothetical protein
VKNRKPRTVPLHEHLIEQGFLAFVKANGTGPLFYNEPKPVAASDPTHPRKALDHTTFRHLRSTSSTESAGSTAASSASQERMAVTPTSP